MIIVNENILDYFGNKLIKEVRDVTIASWDMMLNGKMKGITAQQFSDKISAFNDEQLEVLKWLIPKITDLSLHSLLVMIEQNDEIKVAVYDGQKDNDIKENSDGLEGELYTEDGWINKFSKERY
ncbi:hypothetical protein LL033_23505 [Clostridium estertheticum]|uniref:hypothetical protein n=1 Tax=Clostridium estertheticum TaxID=238834 RepID=UPI001C0B59E3|nr:hypothetical protein [Clostridium estertheticum]MBU3218407.1 hypothetical protein [Clostridium estertheticum]WAG55514.1 hypothetical protein LL033_23505 [Clostridium estertheticum]